MAELPGLVQSLQDPATHLAEFTDKLLTFVPTGTLIQKIDAPLPLAW